MLSTKPLVTRERRLSIVVSVNGGHVKAIRSSRCDRSSHEAAQVMSKGSRSFSSIRRADRLRKQLRGVLHDQSNARVVR